ncbi:coenzyme F420-0:L-glutamate ligase [Vallitalea sp.]|jgi:F420-0:gamma-glutamyl ligase-like protein|uniref:coenzyme F420-0:L-glutamate ligase n=1 Tax=Vallitalea sp. TaxID=1882829 RepID=UPI002600A990|nr:coenzyme F420-0:L-glutamate ligase [Vallitalea sp.]MCT4688185.1 coenzyme F420-0:L-glutamate ligase [Vallitalea sp.]
MYVNDNKKEIITVDNINYSRLAIKTHVITYKYDLMDIVEKYILDNYKKDDLVFISEKMVACTQKRAIPIKDIKPRKLAKILSKYVTKSSYGIGLGMPETMEMAFRECGTLRILLGCFISILGKIFKKSGWFYKIVGDKARGIDGPCEYTLPPYNNYVVLLPDNPKKLCQDIFEMYNIHVSIIDCNDLGINILGLSDNNPYTEELLCKILKDNPLGQSNQQTPIGIIRKK